MPNVYVTLIGAGSAKLSSKKKAVKNCKGKDTDCAARVWFWYVYQSLYDIELVQSIVVVIDQDQDPDEVALDPDITEHYAMICYVLEVFKFFLIALSIML